MENPGSSIISRLGAGSGIDFTQLATDLSDATFAFRRETLQSRNENLELRISATAQLRNSLTELANALGDRIRTGDLAARTNIGNPSVASVSIFPGSSPKGSYSLEVSQLARGQVLASQSYGGGSDLVGEGTLRVRFGSVDGATFTEDAAQAALEINVEAIDTLESLAAKISSESGGALSAYVADGTNGAQLLVKGRDGENNGFVLEGESSALIPTATPGDLSYLSWNPATDGGELRQDSRDALFSFDTVAMRSASNTITNLPENISLELTGTNVGSPTTISFTGNPAGISNVMSDFVAALNDITGQINDNASGVGSTLASDPGVRELKRDLARLSTEVVMPTADEGEPRTLGDLGLRTNRDGTFELDTERLSETLADNPEGAAAMFTTGLFGVFATIDSLARANTTSGDPGSLGGSVQRYEDQIERNDERLADIAEQQERLRERLTRQLVAAEQRITTSQSTLGFLQSQIEIWNNQGG